MILIALRVKFDFDSSLNVKSNFWRPSNESLFYSLKELPLGHGRLVDLDLLEAMHCPIKPLFEAQGWANYFPSTPKVAYEPVIRLFYANL